MGRFLDGTAGPIQKPRPKWDGSWMVPQVPSKNLNQNGMVPGCYPGAHPPNKGQNGNGSWMVPQVPSKNLGQKWTVPGWYPRSHPKT